MAPSINSRKHLDIKPSMLMDRTPESIPACEISQLLGKISHGQGLLDRDNGEMIGNGSAGAFLPR
jgi:hypothetical protein